jgi:glucose-fructose oxidoreductase
MATTYRLGVIGFAHGHVRGLIDRFDELPNVEWVACADTVPEVEPLSAKPTTRGANLKQAQEKTGIPKTYDDYHEMLDTEEFDIIIFCPENAKHAEVAEAVAAHGIHMVTEKPMADTLSNALRMARAAKANDVELMVNWPTTWNPAVRTMKELIDAGTIGDVWQIKYRNGGSLGALGYNKGEDALTDQEKASEWWYQTAPGGGAMLDYCCYGSCLSRWYIGEPAVAAWGMRANVSKHFSEADDNGIIAVRFPQAMALLEGSWSTVHRGVRNGPIAYGTEGTLVADRQGGIRVYTSRNYDVEAYDDYVEPAPLPEGRATPAEAFVHHLETGEPLHPTLEMMFNLDAMAILDAGIRSAASGKQEMVENATWCIG